MVYLSVYNRDIKCNLICEELCTEFCSLSAKNTR